MLLRLTSAQHVATDPQASREHRVQIGIEALEAGQYDEAVKTLTAVMNAAPDFYRPGLGSAAYWAGRALVAAGRPEQAHTVWLVGLKALERTRRIDPRLSDAYVESVFKGKQDAEYARAASVYLRLLEQASDVVDAREQCIVKRHLAQVLPLLTASERARVAESKASVRCEAWRPTEEAGRFLASWWRTRDPRLATERNERLEEHLERAVEAQQHYGHERRVSGLDDRGEIYVRYGKPSRQVFLRPRDNPFVDDLSFPQPAQGLPAADVVEVPQDETTGAANTEGEPALAPVDFGPGEALIHTKTELPGGELWAYEHIDAQGYYFFVKDGRYFRLGQLSDMVPRKFQKFIGYRGAGNAGAALTILGDLSKKLTFVHPDFAARYSALENFSTAVNAGSFAQSARSLWTQLRATEDADAYERDQRMPLQYDETVQNTGFLPVALRTARFLDNDGTTRTEVYWYVDLSLPGQEELAGAFDALGYQRASGAPLIHLTVVQEHADHRPRVVQTEYYLAETEVEAEPSSLPVYTTSVQGDSGLYHVALQWEQYAAQIKGSDSVEVAKGARLRTATERIDSLTALSRAEDRLEMSDVVPVAAKALVSLTFDEDERPPLQPYPFSTLAEQDSLGLYFEIYHLTFGADDQTHYSVEYEVVQRKAGGGLLRFRNQVVRTAAQSPYTGRTRTARDAILLTLEEWVEGELEVIVRVTDETTGQQVERSVAFETTK